MNVRPLNYSWTAFYDRVIDLVRYSFSWRRILRRMRATSGVAPRALNVIRAVSSEGRGRLRYHVEIRRRLAEDPEFRPFFEQETTRVPSFYVDSVRRGLGPFWEWLPQGALRRRPSSGPSHPGGRRVAAAAPAHAGLEKARA